MVQSHCLIASNKCLWSFLAFPPATSVFQSSARSQAFRRSKSLLRLHRSLIWENFIPIQCLRSIDLQIYGRSTAIGLFRWLPNFVFDFWPVSELLLVSFRVTFRPSPATFPDNFSSDFCLSFSQTQGYTLSLRGDVRIFYILNIMFTISFLLGFIPSILPIRVYSIP
jgi:hypothetical protein